MMNFIPYSFSPGSSGSPKRFDADCFSAVTNKERAFKTFKDDPTDESHLRYREARNSC